MPLMPLQPGDPARIADYAIVGRLGQGGMGTVYLASDRAGTQVALKVLRADLVAGPAAPGSLARFRREVRAARRVAPFCTAPVLAADTEAERPWIATEYVDGPSLAAVVAERGPLAGASLEALAVGVATALGAIHAAGIVHRDLTPANVLLSQVGPRVIDFGIAGAMDFTLGLTAARAWLGTPAYMAPEQIAGGPVTAAADVFAWGCLVTFAATGRPPFAGQSPIQVAYSTVHRRPSLDGLEPAPRRLVERCLAKDPARRPSAAELLDQLLQRSPPRRPMVARPPRAGLRVVATVALLAACLVPAADAATPRLVARAAGDPLAGPSAAPALAAATVPALAIAARPSCPLAAFADGGAANGAVPRWEETGDQWSLVWDKPGAPGVDEDGFWCPDCGREVVGIHAEAAGPARPPSSEPFRRTWADGSTASYGVEQAPVRPADEGLAALASVRHKAALRIKGQPCLYSVWSQLGRANLEFLLGHLRLVSAPAAAGRRPR
jgi:hypothetical protein